MMVMAEPTCWCGADRTEEIDGCPSVLCAAHLGLQAQHDAHDQARGVDTADLHGVLVTWSLGA